MVMLKQSSAAIVLSMLAATGGYAAEENLEFKLVVKPLEVKKVEAPNIPGRHVMTMKAFGVAYFKDGRVAAKDFIHTEDYKQGIGPFFGYSTYTFEDGSSIIARYEGENKGPDAPFHGDYTVISGTGKYAGATGTGSFDGVPTKWKDANLLDGKFKITTDAAKAQ
jgi:hypothetical protein